MRIEDTFLPVLIIQNGQIKSCNQVFSKLVGLTCSALQKVTLDNVLVFDYKDACHDINELITTACNRNNSDEGCLITGQLIDCNFYHLKVELHCQQLEQGYIKLYFNVIENKAVDPISGLPNGWAISARATHLLNLPSEDAKAMRLVILSVDNFSTINFRYGFDSGDNYLAILGQKLNKLVNHGLLVRFSNARFGILMENELDLCSSDFKIQVSNFCQHLCDSSLGQLTLDNGITVNKSISIGISSEHIEYNSYFSMEVAAETAMREAERHSDSYYYFSSLTMAPDLVTSKLIIDEFPNAIDKSLIRIHYQPQYDLATNKLVGFEALSRWIHKDLGYVAPDVFIKISEDIGLHFEFDLWVFTKVCKQVVDWQSAGIYTPKIAINISFKTLEMTTFVSRLEAIIESTGCSKDLLEIEVTETASITYMDILINNVRAVRDLGISVAIDDFGTGYSSLSLIRTLKDSLDTLKIDRSLVADICDSKLDKEFARKIIGLGKILDVKVLAEGVETLAQRNLLQALGCDYAQGYYFDKALTKSEAEKLIQNKDTH